MDIEIVESLEGIEAIRPEWEAVWDEDPEADLFSSAPWVINWWKHFGEGKNLITARDEEGDLHGLKWRRARPHVIIMREKGRPVAVSPLGLFSVRWGWFPARVLSLTLNNHSPRGALFVSGSKDRAVPALAAYLSALRSWDILLCDGVKRGSGLAERFLREAAPMGMKGRGSAPWVQSRLVLDGTWEGYLKARSHNFRRTLSRSETVLRSMGGPINIDCYSGGRIDEGIAIFLKVDEGSWKAREGESVALVPSLKDYYSDMTRVFAGDGRAEIWTMSVGGEHACSYLCVRKRGVLYTIKSSYNERFSSNESSPGMLLMAGMVENAFKTGLKEIDFVGWFPFTERWESGVSVFDRFTVFGGGIYPKVLHAVSESKLRVSLWRAGRGHRA